MLRPRYDIVAIDLDGTLFDRAGKVSEPNREAVCRARAAGVRVVICTGRGLIEARHAVEAIEQRDPVVVAGGAIIACPGTGSTIHRFAIDPEAVEVATRFIHDHGHAAIILKDPVAAGYDYLVVTGERGHRVDPVIEWWFGRMKVKVRQVQSLADDEHPEHTVRVGACGLSGDMSRLRALVRETFGDRLTMHNFPAVSNEQRNSELPPGESLHVLEVFDRGATKWSAVRVLADRWGVAPERVAAIGDEINDVSMIAGAGLGIAMGNAVPEVRRVAGRTTLANDQHGVAYALERILSREW
jgi:Cof subfamily protein (haloacid dehalogenase superfamily)